MAIQESRVDRRRALRLRTQEEALPRLLGLVWPGPRPNRSRILARAGFESAGDGWKGRAFPGSDRSIRIFPAAGIRLLSDARLRSGARRRRAASFRLASEREGRLLVSASHRYDGGQESGAERWEESAQDPHHRAGNERGEDDGKTGLEGEGEFLPGGEIHHRELDEPHR